MTPPAAATTAARRKQATRVAARRSPARRPVRTVAPRAARRVSGPAAGRAGLAVGPRGIALGPPPLLAAARFAYNLPDRQLVDRLVRGQAWILLIGFLLMGIVAMQVSLLKLNAGIGRAVERSAALERRNGELRAQVSRLSSGERVQAKAAELGMVMPPPGSVTYLRVRPGRDAAEVADALRAGRLAPGAVTVTSTSPQPQPQPELAVGGTGVAGTSP